ncbi:MAG: hypothetical protein IK117_02410 [Bacteroidales bacterium]|nr:hypothetical protein [Bacteroidales bacterium]
MLGFEMDANAIIQAIGSVGFPIVACCALFYLYDKTITKLTATLEKMDKTLDKLYDKTVTKDDE